MGRMRVISTMKQASLLTKSNNMTKKDYELIASTLSIKAFNVEESAFKIDIINRIATALKKDNPSFDRERFIKAIK